MNSHLTALELIQFLPNGSFVFWAEPSPGLVSPTIILLALNHFCIVSKCSVKNRQRKGHRLKIIHKVMVINDKVMVINHKVMVDHKVMVIDHKAMVINHKVMVINHKIMLTSHKVSHLSQGKVWKMVLPIRQRVSNQEKQGFTSYHKLQIFSAPLLTREQKTANTACYNISKYAHPLIFSQILNQYFAYNLLNVGREGASLMTKEEGVTFGLSSTGCG